MPDLPRHHVAAVHLLAAWMSERYYRTFRVAEGDPGLFDAVLQQRDRRVGVTVGALWDDAQPVAGAPVLEALLTDDVVTDRAIEDGGYAVWVPPRAVLPVDEPALSSLRVTLAKALAGLAPGDRREVRLPVTVYLAKIQDEGAYVSVTGGLAPEWTTLSEGIGGAYHLDARALARLPEERAEVDLIVTRVRDRAAMLRVDEVSEIPVHDTWVVSRLPAGAPPGVSVIASPADLDPLDGALVRRMFRRHVQRAIAQHEAARAASGVDASEASGADMAALALVGALTHLKDELATSALRGMSPASYSAVDLITIAGDGAMRQVLQPRSLPWEASPA